MVVVLIHCCTFDRLTPPAGPVNATHDYVAQAVLILKTRDYMLACWASIIPVLFKLLPLQRDLAA